LLATDIVHLAPLAVFVHLNVLTFVFVHLDV
jgi:hypothetical protein